MKYLVNTPELQKNRSYLRKNQTNAERLLWSKLRNRQLCSARFLRQFSFGNYIVDFYCSQFKLAIEIDGGQHNEVFNQEKDLLRTRYFQNHKIKVLRFWNNEVLTNISGVCEEIVKFVTPPHLPLS